MKRILSFFILALAAATGALAVAAGGPDRISAFAAAADPLAITFAACAGLAVSVFLAGIVTGDYSWVDRLWSIVPVVITWFYAYRAGFGGRTLVATLVVTLWGGRLTFNFARKGGYSGREDYRWPILRQRVSSPLLWQGFNLVFISCIQVGLLVLMTLPAYALCREGGGYPLFGGDLAETGFLALMGLFLLFLSLETKADEEQWAFHEAKRQAVEGMPYHDRYRDDIGRGFRTSGLFARSRHPNYFAEMAQWWCLALAAIIGKPAVLWPLAGAAALTLLFVGSTRFTESLSLAKYPAYRTYRQQVPAIVPRILARQNGTF